MKNFVLVLLWLFIAGLLGYQAGKYRAESYSQLIKQPIFPCGDAKRDFESALWNFGWESSEVTIDSFRSCDSLYVQHENEKWSSFTKRLPKTLVNACVVLRKAVQPPVGYPDGHYNYNVHFIGGSTDGRLKE